MCGCGANQALARDKLTMNSFNHRHRELAQAGKRREALGNLTSASSTYVNVNRTSLDHLLLGRNADVDKNVE
jgi:hypothetical protein